jgi:hypothetical protein
MKDYSHELPSKVDSSRSYTGAAMSPDRPRANDQSLSYATVTAASTAGGQGAFISSLEGEGSSLPRALEQSISNMETQIRLDVHDRVYVSADEYGIMGLKRQACRKFVALAFEPPLYFYHLPVFATVLIYVLENTMLEEDVNPATTDSRHGLRHEVLTRFLQCVESNTLPHFKILEEFEPVAAQIAIQKSAEISRIQGLYDREHEKATFLSEATCASDTLEGYHTWRLAEFGAEVKTLKTSLADRAGKFEELETALASKTKQNNNHRRKIQKIYKRQQRALYTLSRFHTGASICARCRFSIALGTEWVMIIAGANLMSTYCNHCGAQNFLSGP